jgi:hypothetical protein
MITCATTFLTTRHESFRPWSSIEDKTLRERLDQRQDMFRIARSLHRTRDSAVIRAVQLGIPDIWPNGNTKYSPTDDHVLRQGLDNGLSYIAIAESLGRRSRAVGRRAVRLQLCTSEWYTDKEGQLVQQYEEQGRSIHGIAELLPGRNVAEVRAIRTSLADTRHVKLRMSAAGTRSYWAWTAEEIATMRRCAATGMSRNKICLQSPHRSAMSVLPQMYALNIPYRRQVPSQMPLWTASEAEILLKNRHTGLNGLSGVLSRTPRAIQGRLQTMNDIKERSKRTKWTEAEWENVV